jgi:hypothetical protein
MSEKRRTDARGKERESKWSEEEGRRSDASPASCLF